MNNKIIRKENSNISLSKYNIDNLEEKNILKKEISNLSKSPPIQNRKYKYENENGTKNKMNSLDLLQMERRKLYGNNMINNRKQKYNDIYKYYTPIYGNNNKYNIYGINNRSNNEGNKHEQILPNIFSNKSIGGNYSNGSSKIIINKRLKPIAGKKNIIKINQ